jgi:hypothetical protein
MSIPLMEIELKVIEALREEFKRNQWCEQMKARVYWLPDGKWWVDWSLDGWWRTASDPDRDTAIDKARGVK